MVCDCNCLVLSPLLHYYYSMFVDGVLVFIGVQLIVYSSRLSEVLSLKKYIPSYSTVLYCTSRLETARRTEVFLIAMAKETIRRSDNRQGPLLLLVLYLGM